MKSSKPKKKATAKSGGGLSQMVLLHIEKVVGAVLVGVAAYTVYQSLGLRGETRAPSDLQQQASSATQAFQQATWESALANNPEEVKLAYTVAAAGGNEVPPDAYATSPLGWAPPIVPPTVDRPDPVILPATDLEGSAVTGLFAFLSEEITRKRALEEAKKEREREQAQKRAQEEAANSRNPLAREAGPTGGAFGVESDVPGRRPANVTVRAVEAGVQPQGDELIEALSCAVVLAKAPSLKQYEVYKDSFEDARGGMGPRDVPSYLGYRVERAEVVDGELGPWKPVRVTDGQGGAGYPFASAAYFERVVTDWASSQESLMDARYEDLALTEPLPPLVGSGWGPEVVHSDAPLQSETDAKLEDESREAESAQTPISEEEGFLTPGAATGPGMGPGMGRGGRMPGMGRPPRMGGMMMDGGPGMRGMGGMGMRGMGMEGGRSGGGMRSSASQEFDPSIPFKVLRFFDFSVQPGRQYRYRVRLVLEDPNKFVERRYLAREALERIEAAKKAKRQLIREAEWSEPSPVISVPMRGAAKIVEGKPAGKRPGAEGELTLLVESFALDVDRRAQEGAIEKGFRRGAVLNLTDDAEVLTADRRWIDKVKSFEFHTGITLVDFRGGDDLARDLRAPARALYMDAGGRLFLGHELDDKADVEAHRRAFEESPDGAAGYGAPGLGGPGGGEWGAGGRR